ncbi:MAG: DUF4097 family beta strand repeat-containing protein [Clostridia bacterium]
MKKSTRVALIVAAALFVIGVALCGISFAGVGFHWYALSTVDPGEYETKTVQYDAADIVKIVLNIEVDEVRVASSKSAQIELRYTDRPSARYAISVQEGVLTLEKEAQLRVQNMRDWFRFDIGTPDGAVLLTIPEGFNGDLLIQSDVGDVTLQDIAITGTLDCAIQTGEFSAKNLTTSCVKVQNDVGSITGENWIVEHDAMIEDRIGDIKLQNSAFGGILACRNDVGDIKFAQVSTQTADLSARVGDIDFEALATEQLKVITDIGGVCGSIDGQQSEYTILTDSDIGEDNAVNRKGNTDKEINIVTRVGDIDIEFLHE